MVLFDQAVVSATNFLTTILIGNSCGADQLGIYSVGFSVIFLAVAVESAMVSTPFTIFLAREDEKRKNMRANFTVVNLLITMAAVLMLQLLLWLMARPFLDSAYDQIYQMVIIVTPCVVGRGFVRKYLLARFKASYLCALDLIISVSQLGLLYQAAHFGEFTPITAMLIVGGCNLFGFGAFLCAKLRTFTLNRSEVWQRVKADWSFGKWLVAEQILTIMSVYGASWLLALMLDSTAAGIFAACFSITSLSNPFLMGMGNYLLPKFANRQARSELSRSMYWTYTLFTVGVMVLFTLICVCFAEPLLQLFYPADSYTGHWIVLSLLAVRALVGSIGLVPHYALLAMELPKVSLYASIASITGLFVSALFLIPQYGLIGGAVSWIAASTLESGIMIFYLQFKHHETIHQRPLTVTSVAKQS